jgi:phosphate transport system substrate-binding protein
MGRRAALLLVFMVATTACGVRVRGAGSTYAALLYEDWSEQIVRKYPTVQIDYKPVGSGEGIRLFLEGKVDFAGSDVPLTEEQKARAKAGVLKTDVLQIPTTVGAVAPVYNVRGVTKTLRFTPEALAGIFAGTIQSWDDPAIQNENKESDLPSSRIIIVYRSDSSGTTCIFSQFLTRADRITWDPTIRPVRHDELGCQIQWPRGSIGAAGSDALAKTIQDTPNSIGYVEYSYAAENNQGSDVDWGYVRNSSRNFVRARLASIRASTTALTSIPSGSLLESSNDGAYPISALTWLLVPVPPRNGSRKEFCQFLDWMLDAGQQRAERIGYVPLPDGVIKQERLAISQVCP